MITSMLVDTGPLVALFNENEEGHDRCARVLQETSLSLSTTWPVITEAAYLLGFSFEGPNALLEMVERGDLRLVPLDEADVPRLRVLMHKYRDLPMELADASLVRVAEREGLDTVFTLDRRDFAVYRLPRAKGFTIVP